MEPYLHKLEFHKSKSKISIHSTSKGIQFCSKNEKKEDYTLINDQF